MKATALHHLGKSGNVQTTRKFLKSNYVASFDNWRRKQVLEQEGRRTTKKTRGRISCVPPKLVEDIRDCILEIVG